MPISPDPILSIDVGDGLVGGDTLEVDITSLHNDLFHSGRDLGIRLQMADPDPNAGAVTFNNFRIQLAFPEPGSGLLAGVFALSLLAIRRKR